MIEQEPVTLEPMADGSPTVLVGSMLDVDLVAAGYVQSEWRCAGTARAQRAITPLGDDGHWDFQVADRARFATRAVVRKPADPARSSGTILVEWLNVSSGADTCPVFGFAGAEIVRAGHTWVGVSAQAAGIVPAPVLVDVGDVALPALRDADPERYGDLHHPGDAFCFDIFTRVATAIATSVGDGPLAGYPVERLVAVGESQSADALCVYVNGVQPVTGCFDGFFIHSRGGSPMLLGNVGRAVDPDDPLPSAVVFRDDLVAPVLVLQTETDVLGHPWSLPARQADTDRLRVWEVAGSAHADRSVIGEFESLLGCADPVNRGQQRFVVRSAVRHLVAWIDGGPPPPVATPLEVETVPGDGDDTYRFVTDRHGNTVGGVRTPCVDAPVEILTGLGPPGADRVCLLFGRTLAVPADELRARYPSRAAYLAAYEAALDDVIDAGFIVADDRAEVIADARTALVDP